MTAFDCLDIHQPINKNNSHTNYTESINYINNHNNNNNNNNSSSSKSSNINNNNNNNKNDDDDDDDCPDNDLGTDNEVFDKYQFFVNAFSYEGWMVKDIHSSLDKFMSQFGEIMMKREGNGKRESDGKKENGRGKERNGVGDGGVGGGRDSDGFVRECLTCFQQKQKKKFQFDFEYSPTYFPVKNHSNIEHHIDIFSMESKIGRVVCGKQKLGANLPEKKMSACELLHRKVHT
ncbi:hypothetical protein HELRODRAFT_193332 [Helobdella robusta]|uniref:Uncharacterized protein n=1 Tax=Helobdella robusta TaxID=6412 RepID=T1FUW2_HELRO|nr:hypothetical protein HELRODRAFT_193332 [Helobdella robusta]ESN97275.1 hypothetical protein HELRODRAFT_193332 [Helobdella robusta]